VPPPGPDPFRQAAGFLTGCASGRRLKLANAFGALEDTEESIGVTTLEDAYAQVTPSTLLGLPQVGGDSRSAATCCTCVARPRSGVRYVAFASPGDGALRVLVGSV
jgi:hypothetical protein